jgi:hypothetical protein
MAVTWARLLTDGDIPTGSQGDVLVNDGTGWVVLTPTASGQALMATGEIVEEVFVPGTPEFSAVSAGDVDGGTP